MYNFNIEGIENFDKLDDFTSLFQTAGALLIFFVILIAIGIVFLWVFGSIGLMNLAKKKNIPNPWLAFLPVGRSYLIGKLGFEIYDANNKNKTTFMWITFGLGAASFLLGNNSGDLNTLVSYALLFFESWAFYNMFKSLNKKNSVVYTVFTVLTGTLLGGIFLYTMKNDSSLDFKPENKKESQTESPKEVKREKSTDQFCKNCGYKLGKTAKFCPECGNKIN